MPSLQGFKLEEGRFVVVEKNKEYGKITGTGLAGLLGKSKWSTPFITTARMLRLFNEDISAKREVNAGIVLESKILDYVGALHGDELFESRVGDHEDWKSDFEDDIFGGHIDGMMPDGRIVEVKTTRNPEDWLEGPPEYYWIQASLYAHFLKSDKILFLVGFTDDKTLADPDSWVPSDQTLAQFEVPIIPGFDKMLEEAREVYADTIARNRTAAKGTDPMDSRVFNLIYAQNWTEDELNGAIEDIRANQSMMERYKELEKENQDMRDAMMLYLKKNNLDSVSAGDSTVKISRYVRNSLDTDALKRDSLYEIYAKPTTVESIKIVKRK